MPAVVDFSKMKVGHKGGGKHWTKNEVARRAAAAQKLKRKGKVKVKLTPPPWLKSDPDAFRIWKKILKELKGIELLDNLDSFTLATYCKLEAEKEKAVLENDIGRFERLAKTALAYAKDLGLTARSRAGLAKRMADEAKDPNADLFE